MKYAKVINNTVVEVYEPLEGFTIDQCFTPEVAAQFVECPTATEQHWTCIEGVFTEPTQAEIIDAVIVEEEE